MKFYNGVLGLPDHMAWAGGHELCAGGRDKPKSELLTPKA
jgi:hypothetical protein